MEKDNGRGIFYGVIGVATLVVAIVGATFAFFSATTNSNTDAINTSSSNVQGVTLAIEPKGSKSNLIPANYKAEKFATLAGVEANKCVDEAGNNYCSIYTFTITNPNAQAQPIYVSLNPSENTFGNLYFALFKGTPDEGAYNVNTAAATDGGNAAAASVATNGQLVIGPTKLGTTAVSLSQITQLLGASSATNNNDEVTYTLILWINEINDDQTTADANKSFKAGLTVSSGADDRSGVTAVLGTVSTTE